MLSARSGEGTALKWWGERSRWGSGQDQWSFKLGRLPYPPPLVTMLCCGDKEAFPGFPALSELNGLVSGVNRQDFLFLASLFWGVEYESLLLAGLHPLKGWEGGGPGSPFHKARVVVWSFSHVQLFMTPWTRACQALLSSTASRRVGSNSCW